MTFTEWVARWNLPPQAIREYYELYQVPEGKNDRTVGFSEAAIQGELVRCANPSIDTALWRNNMGAATDESGRLIRYGLGHVSKKFNLDWKSSDLIGITPIVVTARHVGYRLGVFTAVEVKEPGWTKPTNEHERGQANFLASVISKGGIGMFATDSAHYLQTVNAWRNV